MKIILIFLFSMTAAVAFAQSDLRARQTAACQGDAMNLCGPLVPDEAKIAACLVQQMPRLSPAGQAMFKGHHKRHH